MSKEAGDRGEPLVDVVGPDGPARMPFQNARDVVVHGDGWSFKDHDRAHAAHRAWALEQADKNLIRRGAVAGGNAS